MLRGTLRPDALSGERYFRWRGGAVSRLEGLADAVFALALTLLVVRLEVPSTFAEVKHALFRAPVYIACFALFLWIWHCHFQFHRRYGLEGPVTLTLDGAILFVVLLFALPLRFIADLIYDALRFQGPPLARGPDGMALIGPDGQTIPSLELGDRTLLMSFYAGGFALLFLLFALQTWNAYRRADVLELDEVERLITRHALRAHLASSAVGVASLVLAISDVFGGAAAGLVFWAMGPMHGVLGWRHGRAVSAKAEEMGIA